MVWNRLESAVICADLLPTRLLVVRGFAAQHTIHQPQEVRYDGSHPRIKRCRRVAEYIDEDNGRAPSASALVRSKRVSPGKRANRNRLAMDLRQWAPQHGDWRNYTSPKTEYGCLKSTSVPLTTGRTSRLFRYGYESCLC